MILSMCRLPVVEKNSRPNHATKNPYSFGPSIKYRNQQFVSSDEVLNQSISKLKASSTRIFNQYILTLIDSGKAQSSLSEIRPKTHPPSNENQSSSLNDSQGFKQQRLVENSQRKHR